MDDFPYKFWLNSRLKSFHNHLYLIKHFFHNSGTTRDCKNWFISIIYCQQRKIWFEMISRGNSSKIWSRLFTISLFLATWLKTWSARKLICYLRRKRDLNDLTELFSLSRSALWIWSHNPQKKFSLDWHRWPLVFFEEISSSLHIQFLLSWEGRSVSKWWLDGQFRKLSAPMKSPRLGHPNPLPTKMSLVRSF